MTPEGGDLAVAALVAFSAAAEEIASAAHRRNGSLVFMEEMGGHLTSKAEARGNGGRVNPQAIA